MEIKKAETKDINEQFLKIFSDLCTIHFRERPDYFFDPEKENLPKILQYYIEEKETYILLEDQKIIGFAIIEEKREGKPVIRIKEIIIDEHYRHQGYGKKLVEYIKQLGKEKGCSALEFWCRAFNTNALQMYEHIGMKVQKIILETDL